MKAIVPENKRDEKLIAQGRALERAKEQRDEQKDELDKLKKERNAARRDADEAMEVADAGKASHRLVMGLSAATGTGAGFAAQHYGMDRTSVNKWVKKGTVPVAGLVVGSLGLMLDGIPGAATTGFFFGMTFGSAVTSGTKAALGVA